MVSSLRSTSNSNVRDPVNVSPPNSELKLSLPESPSGLKTCPEPGGVKLLLIQGVAVSLNLIIDPEDPKLPEIPGSLSSSAIFKVFPLEIFNFKSASSSLEL